MRGVNKVILVGNLGKDPEVQYLESGTCLAKFPLATSDSYKDKSGNKVDQTEWHNIVVWRGLAEIAEKYLSKGKGLYLEGKIKTRSWDDKDGNKRYTTEIVCDNFVMLGGGRGAAEVSGADLQEDAPEPKEKAEATGGDGEVAEEPTDDLPF